MGSPPPEGALSRCDVCLADEALERMDAEEKLDYILEAQIDAQGLMENE